jgi:hypothetical protein
MTKRSTPVLPALLPLSDDPTQSQFMRDLLQAGRDASVTDYNFDQGLSKHLALIETGAPAPHWAEALRQGAGAAPTAAGSSLLPWLAVPIVAAAMVTAAVFVSRDSAPQAVQAPQAVPTQQPGVPAVAAPASAPAPTVAPSTQPSLMPRAVSREAASARPARGVRMPRAERHATSVSSSSAAPRTSANPKFGPAPTPASTELFAQAQPAVASHSAADQTHVGEARTEAAADEPAAAAEKPQAQVARNVPPQPVVQDDSKLEREMAMLAMAQRVLLTDPARSLGLARQGEAEFAGSMFTQERQQLLLLSLVRLGRLDEAKRLAKPYLARYPAGPFSDRVRHALATGKVER